MSETMLQISGLVAGYGKNVVVREAALEVGHSKIVGLVGHNGAGKTTLVKSLNGIVPRRAGDVRLDGAPLPASPVRAARAGIVLVPQGRGLFPGLSVEDNIRIGAVAVGRQIDEEFRSRIVELFPQLADLFSRRAGHLSGGQQQMVAIARGLAAGPKVLVVDELSLGLAPVVIDAVWNALTRLRERTEISVLVIDQNLARMTARCDELYRLEDGRTHLMSARERQDAGGLIL